MRIRVRVRTDGRFVRRLHGLLTPGPTASYQRRPAPQADVAEEERDEYNLWQSANRLVQQIHDLSEDFPRGGAYPLRAGLRRTAISFAVLIAQAQMKEDTGQQLNILGKAQVALAEFEVQIDLASHRDLLTTVQLRDLFGELVSLSRQLTSRCRIVAERAARREEPKAPPLVA